MSKKKQKFDTSPIVITLTVDPTLKTDDQGERYMSTTMIARRGDVAQMSSLEVRNWKVDLPNELDRLVRLMIGGFELPAFPNMADVKATGEAKASTEATDEESTEEADQELAAAAAGEVATEQDPEPVEENIPAEADTEYDLEPVQEEIEDGEGGHEDQYDEVDEPVTGQPSLL